jgi:hypothetical protein
MLYAMGEIVLVVAGILIALQINNWNEKNKQRENFGLALEQIYNEIDVQAQSQVLMFETTLGQLDYIDLLLAKPEKIPDAILPFVLFFVDSGGNIGDILYNQPDKFRSIMAVDPGDISQIRIEKQIASFMDNHFWRFDVQEGLIAPFLYEAGIPIPPLIFGLTDRDNFQAVDTAFYTVPERETVRNLLKDEKIRTALRTLRADRVKITTIHLANMLADAASVQQLISQFNPKVRLLYNEVGIIGTAIAGYEGVSSTPMTLTNAELSLWETDLYLKKGTVKFRTRNNWKQNWGGKSFPRGNAIFYWENIPVEEGYYHIELNLMDKTYSFTKKEAGSTPDH